MHNHGEGPSLGIPGLVKQPRCDHVSGRAHGEQHGEARTMTDSTIPARREGELLGPQGRIGVRDEMQ